MKKLFDKTGNKGARLTPSERRDSLINATLRSIIKHGHEGLSVRTVCQEAGVSAGLLTHHFAGKEDLIAETYRKLTTYIYSQIDAALKSAPEAPPEERLRLYIDTSFRHPVLDKDYLLIWLVFWSLSRQKPEIATLRNDVSQAVIKTLQTLIDDIVSVHQELTLNTHLAATGLSALMDGLWLEWSLNPTNVSPEEATQICQSWVDALLSNGLNRLT